MNNKVLTVTELKNKKYLDEINAIWYAIMKMDVSELMFLLDDKINYEDVGKEKFIELLKDRFNEHKGKGDSQLYLGLDYCLGCKCNQPVCKFTGDNSGKEFALYFEIKDNKISDIYHCNWYGEQIDLPF